MNALKLLEQYQNQLLKIKQSKMFTLQLQHKKGSNLSQANNLILMANKVTKLTTETVTVSAFQGPIDCR